MTDLLIGGLFDLSGAGWHETLADRFAASFLPGIAGDVLASRIADGFVVSRAFGRPAGGHRPKVRSIDRVSGADGSITLFAGRIHDAADVRARFGLPPCDSPAMLYAAVQGQAGEDCDLLLAGDYAVIQWFPKLRRLRLARSPISQFPLHVWRSGDRLAVASIPRPLFAAGASSDVDDTTVVDRMLFNFTSDERSWYRALTSSPCGAVTCHDPLGRSLRRYWSVSDVPDVRLPRDEDYVEAVDALFDRAVAQTLSDIERPAISLSGGLDSQAVASYVCRQLPAGRTLPAYTSVPMRPTDAMDDHFADESDHVRALVSMYPQIEVEFLDCPDGSVFAGMTEETALGGWPVHNQFVAYWGHESYRRAAARGCDALLTGGMGNPGFSYHGLTGFPTWLRTGRWRRLISEAAASPDPRPTWRKGAAMALRPYFPRAFRLWRDARRGRPADPFASWCPLRENFVHVEGGLARAIAACADPTMPAARSAREWRRDVILNSQVESPELQTATALQYGVEYRDPTAYRPLLDFCIGIPDEQYLRGGQTRWLARRLLAGRVPEMVRTETRTGWQSTDWPVRIARERSAIRGQLASFAADPRIARVFDFDRLIAALDAWPGADAPHQDYRHTVHLAVSRAVSTAHFIRFAEGRNVG